MSLKIEMLVAKGRLAELKNEAMQLGISISGDIDAVRMFLPPSELAKLEDIKAQQASAQCVEMAGKHAEYLGKLEEIKAIEKALGE